MISFVSKLFFVLIISLFFSRDSIYSQNLVNNPDFENFSLCPHSVGEVYKCTGWSSFGNSSDYFNSCDTGIVNVPNNLFGSLSALTGNAYCGFYNFTPISNYREYLGSQLTDSLQIANKYFISINVALAKSQGYNCWSNKVGVLFSTIPYNDSTPPFPNNYCHLFAVDIITDTTNWINISGSFVADSNYKYVIIGNFFDNLNTDTMNCFNSSWSSYFYVDQLCVSADSLVCSLLNNVLIFDNYGFKDKIKIFPNPAENSFFIENNSMQEIKEIYFYNCLGEAINMHKEMDSNKGFKIEFWKKLNGIYYIKMIFNNHILISKIIVI